MLICLCLIVYIYLIVYQHVMQISLFIQTINYQFDSNELNNTFWHLHRQGNMVYGRTNIPIYQWSHSSTFWESKKGNYSWRRYGVPSVRHKCPFHELPSNCQSYGEWLMIARSGWLGRCAPKSPSNAPRQQNDRRTRSWWYPSSRKTVEKRFFGPRSRTTMRT